ncbi:MAG: pyridoxal phosphate-dependent aminotransferase family protein [Lewinellaceae bacterium]|nr:pyridoxal phosphate-dependent aminotransferase family protein [Lewinellaceae bacterium]
MVTPQLKEKDLGLRDFLQLQKQQALEERATTFTAFSDEARRRGANTYARMVVSPADRKVVIQDPFSGKLRAMLMFASNNYLGLANHPYVKEKVKAAIDKFGVGLGGPPLLNGYTRLMSELEARLAALKKKPAALVFSSGYGANLGLISALVKENDRVLYDELSHASFHDGLRMAKARADSFAHNDLTQLEALLKADGKKSLNLFVGVEGVYSMDGDMAPLDKIVELCHRYGAFLWLDDAHGTGILGEHGGGTAEEHGVEESIDLSMGTFSKAFAVTGGFLAASREIIEYIRYFARPYVFSAALPPVLLAAVLAGLDVLEQEPERRTELRNISQYAAEKLRPFGLTVDPQAAIIAIRVPEWMNIRRANYLIHQRGIFLNAIEFPAVPENQQRFRISLMVNHTKEDVDLLAAVLEEVWDLERKLIKG